LTWENEVATYQDFVDEIFGVSEVPESRSPEANNVIGALERLDAYGEFKASFRDRLRRLGTAWGRGTADRRTLLQRVSNVNERGWEGAFAELSAYDFLSGIASVAGPLSLDVTVPAARTLAGASRTTANLDFQFAAANVYGDVKSLKDVVGELLGGVLNDAIKGAFDGTRRPRLENFEYPLHASFTAVQRVRSELVGELRNALVQDPDLRAFRSGVLHGLTYRFAWTGGTLVTELEYQAEVHADVFSGQVFGNYDKFMRDAPCVLVFVVFPWWNQTIHEYGGRNTTFYRATTRRVFAGYKDRLDLLTTLVPSFSGQETVYEASKCISGLVFLDDKSVLAEARESRSLRAHLFFNSSATNPLPESFRAALTGAPGVVLAETV
jgi:hypothetical protein